jgi:hypothetical protein
MESYSGKMNKLRNGICYALCGIIIFFIVFYKMTPSAISGEKPVMPQDAVIPNMLYSVVRDGDIICRLGDRLWSQLFKDVSVTDKRFSHMGIIRINNGQFMVINAEGDTGHGRDSVNEVTIEEFLKVARAAGIYRINDIDGKEISDLAVEYFGVPFDWKFNMADGSKLYCTELLYVILRRIMPELELKTVYVKEMGIEVIPLDAISDSQHFSEVYCFGF